MKKINNIKIISGNDDVDISGTLTAGTITGMLSSSAQIASDISGSLGENADLIRTLTAQTISGSAGYTST